MKLYPKVLLLLCVAFIAGFSGCNKAPEKSDAQLYREFYGSLEALMGKFDDAYSPFMNIIETSNDPVDAVVAARRIKDEVYAAYGKLNALEVPDLKNDEAEAELNKAKKDISDAYLNKFCVVSGYIDYAEEPSIKRAADLKEFVNNINPLFWGGIAELFSVEAKLGLSRDKGGKLL